MQLKRGNWICYTLENNFSEKDPINRNLGYTTQIQLDYNSGPTGSPTLWQMIMGLTVTDNDTPLFHSVDFDLKR